MERAQHGQTARLANGHGDSTSELLVEQFVSNDNNRLKMEVQKLRNDFNQMLTKYSNLENSNFELNTSFNSIQRQNEHQKHLKQTYELKPSIDLPAIITESHSVNKIAALNNYLIKNIIDPNESLTDLNQTNVFKSFRNDNNNNFFSSHHDSFLNIKQAPLSGAASCNECQHQPYLDLLKYELGKRIELQVAKDMPLANHDHHNRNLNDSVDKLMSSLSYNLKSTTNYDSLYNHLNYPQNSRVSNMSNVDLLNSLRSKFLI
jgi:hypothetical protein